MAVRIVPVDVLIRGYVVMEDNGLTDEQIKEHAERHGANRDLIYEYMLDAHAMPVSVVSNGVTIDVPWEKWHRFHMGDYRLANGMMYQDDTNVYLVKLWAEAHGVTLPPLWDFEK